MLEPDVTKRANMKQVSECLWVKQNSSGDLKDLSNAGSADRKQKSTQTDNICTYHLANILGEFNSRKNSYHAD